MRRIFVLIVVLTPEIAFAHVGHIGELAGHGHWIALGALGIATVVGALAAGKGKGADDDAQDASKPDETEDLQEAAA